MGSLNSKPPLGDLDIYFCGIRHNTTNYRIINRIFTYEDRTYNDKIKLINRDKNYYINNEYNYEYRYMT